MEEIVETVITITEIADLLKSIFDSDGDGELIPQEIKDLLESFSDGELGGNDIEDFLETFSDGEFESNDVEVLLSEIKNSLMYDEKYTALSEISSRLELIDTRLDKEFEVINLGFSFIITSIVALLSWKFFGWIIRLVSI